MKLIQNLGITTKEGLIVKNLQRFPSMEWGEEGGLQAEIWYNGKLAATVFNAGDGGCCEVSWKNTSQNFKVAVYNFLIRVRPDEFGPLSKYEWSRKNSPDNVNDDDLESVVIEIESRYDLIKHIKKLIKKDATTKAVIVLQNEIEYKFLNARSDAITPEVVDAYMKKNNIKNYALKEIVLTNNILLLKTY